MTESGGPANTRNTVVANKQHNCPGGETNLKEGLLLPYGCALLRTVRGAISVHLCGGSHQAEDLESRSVGTHGPGYHLDSAISFWKLIYIHGADFKTTDNGRLAP